MFNPFSRIRREVQIIINNRLDEAEAGFLERLKSIDEAIEERYDQETARYENAILENERTHRLNAITIEADREMDYDALRVGSIDNIISSIRK